MGASPAINIQPEVFRQERMDSGFARKQARNFQECETVTSSG